MHRLIRKIPAFSFFLCSTIFLSMFLIIPSIAKIGLIVSLFAVRWKKIKLSYSTIFFMGLYLFSVFFMQLLGQDAIVVNRIIFFILGIIIVKSWTKNDFDIYSKLMTRCTIILLIGAVIGEIYSLKGLPGIPVHINPDDSVIALYLTTLATTNYGGAIRASGIFDEAGAFVFVIWVTIITRSILKKKENINYILIFLGLLTFSFIHVFVSAIYLSSQFKYIFKPRNLLFVLLSITLLGVMLANIDLSTFYERFKVEDGKFVGDNRSGQVISFFDNINAQIFLFGDNENIKKGNSVIDYSSNPFNPIVNNGIIVSFPFYLMLFYIIRAIFLSRNRSLWLIFFLLLLQRPYLFTFGYSYLIVIVFNMLQNADLYPTDILSYKKLSDRLYGNN